MAERGKWLIFAHMPLAKLLTKSTKLFERELDCVEDGKVIYIYKTKTLGKNH